MQFSTVVLALATAAGAVAQSSGSCSGDHASKFAISVVKPPGTSKRDVEVQKRAACGSGDNSLTIQLKGGVLTDQNSRTGYIASNYQFQFDAPPQANHLETSGFQICSNNSLALNGNAVWYQCLSGSFYNLYNKNWAAQCKPVEIMAVDCSGDAAANPTTGTPAATPAPSAASGGSAAAPSASQINDGQPQAPSAAPAPSIATGAGMAYGPQVLLAAAGFAGAAFL